MPVIAISVSKKVHDYYHSIQSGTRSERFNNILERHCRIFEKGHSAKSHMELETALQQQIQAREALQAIVLELQSEIETLAIKKLSIWGRILNRILSKSPEQPSQ